MKRSIHVSLCCVVVSGAEAGCVSEAAEEGMAAEGAGRPCDDEEDGCLCRIVFLALRKTRIVEVSWIPGIDKNVLTLLNKGFSILS